MESTVRGIWLRNALDAAGVTPYQAAKRMGVKPDKLYRHINDDTKFLCSASLNQLWQAVPTLNLNYIITGQGEPLLPA